MIPYQKKKKKKKTAFVVDTRLLCIKWNLEQIDTKCHAFYK